MLFDNVETGRNSKTAGQILYHTPKIVRKMQNSNNKFRNSSI